MAFLKNAKAAVTGGAELTRPRLSVGWIIGGIIAVVLLLVVYTVGKWAFGKASAPVQTAIAGAPVIGSNATQTTEMSGWIY
jgi:hypothetical protein